MCRFRCRIVASLFCLDKHSPKGSCHLDESSMSHTLAQNNLCEFWCGMHLTCKNTPVTPDRKDLKIRSEKDQEDSLSKPLLDATYPSEPNRYLLDRLRQLCSEKRKRESRNQLFDMPVLGLADCHSRRLENWKLTAKLFQTSAGTSRWSAWISYGHHRELRWAQLYGPSVPPCMRLKKSELEVLHLFRRFLSHTPTHTHTRDTYCNDLWITSYTLSDCMQIGVWLRVCLILRLATLPWAKLRRRNEDQSGCRTTMLCFILSLSISSNVSWCYLRAMASAGPG